MAEEGAAEKTSATLDVSEHKIVKDYTPPTMLSAEKRSREVPLSKRPWVI